MISVYRRGKVFYAHWHSGGVQHRQSLHTRDATVAAALARKMEMELLVGKRFQPMRWREFSEEFQQSAESQVRPSTLKSYRFTVKKLTAYLADVKIDRLQEIDPQVIVQFMDRRRKEIHPSTRRPMSEGGVKFELRILRRVFNYAIEHGYIAKNPVRAKNLNATAGRTLPFSQSEITAMLSDLELQVNPSLHAMILFFLHTGLRRGDVADLRKKDLQGNRLVRRTEKRRRVVSLAIHPDAMAALDAHFAHMNPAQKASEYLFPSIRGGSQRNNMYRALRQVWKRTGVRNAHPHRFRDTFAVRLLSKGASLYDVAKLLGISVATAEKSYAPYVLELQKRGAELVEKLDFVSEQILRTTLHQNAPDAPLQGSIGAFDGIDEKPN